MSGQFSKIFGSDGDRGREAKAVETPPREKRAPDEAAEVTITRAAGEPAAPEKPAATARFDADQFETHIGAGSSIEGKITCKGPVRFSGDIKGDIAADSLVAIEDGATVTANLDVLEARIGGRVVGNVSAVNRIILDPTARIEGDIYTPSLSIAEGAQVKGRVDVAPDAGKPRGGASRSPGPAQKKQGGDGSAYSAFGGGAKPFDWSDDQ